MLSGDGERDASYFTAAGARGEPALTYRQRLFETEARLVVRDGPPALVDWTTAVGSVEVHGVLHQRDMVRREGGRWRLPPPIIDADGVDDELERPHVVMLDGRHHCFWST